MNPKDSAKKAAIASRLVLAREQSGLSQGQVAKLMGLHRPTISETEAGRRNVTAQELGNFAEIYGVSVTWLSCDGVLEEDTDRDRIELAARELAKLKSEDLDKVVALLKSLRRSNPRQ